MKKDVCLQLWTIQEVIDHSMEEAIALAAGIGYTSIETNYIQDRPHEEIKAILDRYGMRMLTLHVQCEDLFNHKEEVAAIAKLYGCEYLVCPWASFDDEEDKTPFEMIQDLAGKFNSVVDFYEAQGFPLAYHNHAHEFQRLPDGRLIYDVLFEALDPRVKCELDTHWTVRGGADLMDVLKRYSGRIALLHVKNFDPDRPTSFVDMDEGKLDFPSIIALTKAGGTKHYIIEQDESDHPIETARTNYRELAKLL